MIFGVLTIRCVTPHANLIEITHGELSHSQAAISSFMCWVEAQSRVDVGAGKLEMVYGEEIGGPPTGGRRRIGLW